MSDAKLLPCPFCGSAPDIKFIGNDSTKSRKVQIRCPECRIEHTDAAILHSHDWLLNVATKCWNRRANPTVKESLTVGYDRAAFNDDRILQIRDSVKCGDGWDGDTFDLAFARDIISAKSSTYPVITENERDNLVDDLAALVRRLVHSLSKAAPDNTLPAKAVDYLQRKGLQGSPLRDGSVKLDDVEKSVRFAGMVLAAHRNDGYPGDIDGSDLQRMALECGMIEEKEVEDRCGETCSCAELGGSMAFPTQCMFTTDAGKSAIAAITPKEPK